MTLKQTIDGLLKYAQSSGGPARVRLPKGLTISIKVEGDVAAVQLSRADVFPASLEWKTVIQQWPGQITVIQAPKPLKGSGMYYLSGKVRMVPALVQ